MDPKTFLNADETKSLEEAIREAELKTSGEIRIHIERSCEDPFARGKEIFAQLKMHETAEKNGVLFYLAVVSRKFSILGDEGINKKVPPDFWNTIKDMMATEFAKGQFCEGLRKGALAAGEQLASFFPHKADDVNELPNTISFGDK